MDPSVEIQRFEPRPRPLVCFFAIETVPLGSKSVSLGFLNLRELGDPSDTCNFEKIESQRSVN